MKLFKISLMNNFTYDVPKDKEQLIYDFYAVTNLSGGMLPGFPEPLHSSFRRNEDTLDFIRKEIMNQLCDYLIPHLKKALLFSVSAEFRHLFDKVNSSYDEISVFFSNNKASEFWRKYATEYSARNSETLKKMVKFKDPKESQRFKDDNTGYVDSFKSVLNTGYSAKKFFLIAEKAFNELSWSSSFGGRPWGEIAKYGAKLYDIKDNDELMTKITLIDHIYHLQHNTNTVFNKLKSYYKGGYSWIKSGLDFRADSTQNFYKLVDKCSDGLRPFLYALIHDMYGISRESFEQKKHATLLANEKTINKNKNNGSQSFDTTMSLINHSQNVKSYAKLEEAVIKNDLEGVILSLQENKFDEKEITSACSMAAQYGFADIVRYFIYGDNIEYQGMQEDANIKACLKKGIAFNKKEVVQIIFDASIDDENNEFLKEAIYYDKSEIVKQLLDNDWINVDKTLYHHEPSPVIDHMLKSYIVALPNKNIANKFLIESVEKDSIDGVIWAIKHGANINTFNAKALEITINNSDTNMFLGLVKNGANINSTYHGSLLSIAIGNGNWKIVEYLIQNMKNVGVFGHEALKKAVAYDDDIEHQEIVKKLLKFVPNGAQGVLNDALYTASYHSNKEIANILLEHGAQMTVKIETMIMANNNPKMLALVQEYYKKLNANKTDKVVDKKSTETVIPVQSMMDAITTGNESAVEDLLDKVDINYNNGIFLTKAVETKSIDMVKLLVENGASININNSIAVTTSFNNNSPLIYKYLMEKGGSIHSYGRKYRYLGTEDLKIFIEDIKSLADAYPQQSSTIFKDVLNQYFEEQKNNQDKKTLEMVASPNAYEEISSLINEGYKFGGEHLLIACAYGHSERVELFIEQGVNIHYKNDEPLAIACASGVENVVEILIKNGANVNAQGGRPLKESFYNEKWFIVRMLIKNGANIHLVTTASKSGIGVSKLQEIKNQIEGQKPVVDKIDKYFNKALAANDAEKIKYYLELGAKIDNRVDGSLTFAVIKGYTEAVKILLDYGAIISKKALTIANQKGNKFIINLLNSYSNNQKNDNVLSQNEKNEKNQQLISLIESGTDEKLSVKLQAIIDTIKNGANPNLDFGKPLATAIKLSKYEYVSVLVESGAIVTEYHISLIGRNHPSSMQKHTKEYLIKKMGEQENNSKIEQAKDSIIKEIDSDYIGAINTGLKYKTPKIVEEKDILSLEFENKSNRYNKKDMRYDTYKKDMWYNSYKKDKQAHFKIWNKKHARLKNI